MSRVVVNIEVTSSKILAYIIVGLSAYGMLTGNLTSSDWILALGIAVGLYANKQYQDRKKVCNDKE